MAERRKLLDRMEGLPGLPFAILAVVAFLVVVFMHQRTSDKQSASTAIGPASPSPASTTSVPPIDPVLDPHAGREVLPPRTMPMASKGDDVDASSATLVAQAFAANACQFDPTEPAEGFADRVAHLATADVVNNWQRAAGTVVRCMQLNTGLDPTTPDAEISPVIVHVTAVQVYRHADQSLTAYRWATELTLMRTDGGQWEVIGG